MEILLVIEFINKQFKIFDRYPTRGAARIVANYNKYNNTLESITFECYLSELIKVIYGYRYVFILYYLKA